VDDKKVIQIKVLAQYFTGRNKNSESGKPCRFQKKILVIFEEEEKIDISCLKKKYQ
jgi:hypothetical protein